MNTFKRKTLHAAVLAGLGAVGIAGTAQAVHVNPEHLGSALIYPYYTVRGDGGGTSVAYYDNLISIVNTTASTKAVKVRFLEGKRSQEVLDFNLFLSPFDVWTGAVTRTSAATDGDDGARLVSGDKSCVVPNALFSTASTNTANHFKNFAYAASNDGGGTTLDRTREGYLEVLEMGDITNLTAIAAATHVQGASNPPIPGNCAYFEANDATLATQMTPPSGGLYGGLSLINVRAGTDYSYDAVALDQWSPATVQYTPSNSLLPPIAPTGGSTVSNVFTSGGVVASTWLTSRDAVSATMMQFNLFNEWVLDTGTTSGTDWVVTFPTKKLYVSVGTGFAIPPFNANFNAGQSCDIFTASFYNREETTTLVQAVIIPSPPPVILPSVNSFCYEANVLTFSNSNNLGSTNAYNVDTRVVGSAGHLIINFNQAVQVLTPAASTINAAAAVPQRHFGLPVVGFMVQDFENGNVGTPPVLSAYGGNFNHKYRRQITP